MQTVGNITGYVDLAQILLYVFWIFFAGLIYYLAMENHREGYPMESTSNGRAVVKGFPIPEPKTFLLEGGKSVTVPDLMPKSPLTTQWQPAQHQARPSSLRVMPCWPQWVLVLMPAVKMCQS
jgi:photosynthetic reaction center H subunit